MKERVYTVLIVPERSSKVRRLQIPHQTLMRLGVALCALVALSAFLTVHYLRVVDAAGMNRNLKDENILLKTRLSLVQDELTRIDGTLQRIDKFSSKVRNITSINDPSRDLAIGPLTTDKPRGLAKVLYAPDERIGMVEELVDSKLALRMVEGKLDAVADEALSQERQMHELHDHFALDPQLVSNTPSIRPVASRLLNSGFGMRRDPHTGNQVMHKGIDFAAEHGTDVVATATGLVVYAGSLGEYGKTLVVDHGYGMQTHYSHLSSFKAEVGQQVERGHVIGAVGNTGRTTGVHLHYEVRFMGVPQDPARYLLE